MPVKKKDQPQSLAPALDRVQLVEEIEALSASLAMVKKLLALNLGTKEGKGRNMTAVAQFFAAQIRIEANLNVRRAELRAIDGTREIVDPDSMTAEICAAMEDDWPIGLVERIYQSCRARLKIDDHLPEAPKHLWH